MSTLVASPRLLIAGLVAFVVGWLLRSWAARHNLIDVAKDAALGAAWEAARTRSMPGMPTAVTDKVGEITSETSHVGRAKKAAGLTARHFIAQVIGLVGLALLLVGLALAALGLFWK